MVYVHLHYCTLCCWSGREPFVEVVSTKLNVKQDWRSENKEENWRKKKEREANWRRWKIVIETRRKLEKLLKQRLSRTKKTGEGNLRSFSSTTQKNKKSWKRKKNCAKKNVPESPGNETLFSIFSMTCAWYHPRSIW